MIWNESPCFPVLPVCCVLQIRCSDFTLKIIHPMTSPDLWFSYSWHAHPKSCCCVFCVTGMLKRRPTVEDFVDALVSELNPNFETFIMDSESWKRICLYGNSSSLDTGDSDTEMLGPDVFTLSTVNTQLHYEVTMKNWLLDSHVSPSMVFKRDKCQPHINIININFIFYLYKRFFYLHYYEKCTMQCDIYQKMSQTNFFFLLLL